MALEQEVATYRRLLTSLQSDEGRFALIKGEALCGVYSSYQDALADGYKQFKLEPFLVQEIRAVEQVHFITRFADASCLT